MAKKIESIDFTKIISHEEIQKAAKETGFLKRSGGKINPFDFFMVLVFRLATSVPPALRLITSLLEKPVSRTGIHKKFTEKAVDFFKRCLQIILAKQIVENQTKQISTEQLQPFDRVIIADSSSWDISSQLKEIYKGSGGSASDANCKLQFAYDYKSGSIILVDDMPGVLPDQKYSKTIGNIANKNDLIITDLGYWNFESFYNIDKNEAFFVSRFNNIVNPWVLEDEKYIKINLLNIFEEQMNNSFETEIFIKGKKNKYLKVRLIAFRVPEEVANMRKYKLKQTAKKKGKTPTQKSLKFCEWSIFVTNAKTELIPSCMIRSIYRIRWCCELIFKSWKSILRMNISNVRKNHNRLKCELYAKLILAVIVHTVHSHLQNYIWLKEKKEISFDCLWKDIISCAESLHTAIKKSVKYFSQKINSMLNLFLKTCRKNHQPSRKTTFQMIDELIGDPMPLKISISQAIME
jgi:hypothetical protein